MKLSFGLFLFATSTAFGQTGAGQLGGVVGRQRD
jgi:hypothetical protein